MDYVFVLEDDPVYRRQIEDAIKTMPGQFQVKIYDSLAAFAEQIKSLMLSAKGLNTSDEEEEQTRIRLVICKMEFIGPDRLRLLSKTKDFFVRRNLCTADEPTQFVLTAFDDPTFKIDKYKKPILANLVVKPFDKLMLEQHMQMAIEGANSKGSGGRFANQKIVAMAEMLKSVDVVALNEIGFRSVSNRAFEVGAVNKYYGKEFESEKNRSVMARLLSCVAMPDATYQMDFHYFGLDATQITNIRKKLKGITAKTFTKVPHPKGEPNPKPLFLILDPDETSAKAFAGTLTRKISGAEIVHFKTKQEWDADFQLSKPAKKPALSVSWVQITMGDDLIITKGAPDGATLFGSAFNNLHLAKFLKRDEAQALGMWLMSPKSEYSFKMAYGEDISAFKIVRQPEGYKLMELADKERRDFLMGFRKVKKPLTALYISHHAVDPNAIEGWSAFYENMQPELAPNAPAFMLSSREFTDEQERALGSVFADIFFVPLDKPYMMQKLMFIVPGLKINEDPVEVFTKPVKQVVRAANPVTVTEISEASMVIQYYRPIDLDEFRDFILWQPNELTAPELSGRVFKIEDHGSEKSPAKIRFVFFGVKDHQAKGVRLWSLNNYIAKKDKDNK